MRYLISIFTFLVITSAYAAVESPKGKITGYYTGWASNNVRVKIMGAGYTEVPTCAVHDGYVVKGTTGKYEAHTSALLAAFTSGKEVRVVLDSSLCVSGRPKIIGVYID